MIVDLLSVLKLTLLIYFSSMLSIDRSAIPLLYMASIVATVFELSSAPFIFKVN